MRGRKNVRESGWEVTVRVRESVDVHSLRYTSIYSKLKAARRENCFVTFFVYAAEIGMT